MAFTVLTEDPSTREVGDLIILGDRFRGANVLGQLDHNFVDKVEGDEGTEETETVEPDEDTDDEEEDDDTESERS
jgi:hypothetical protein